MVDWAFVREAVRAALEGGSQRRETPFSSNAEATAGRIVLRALSSISRVSTALQAAG